MFDPSTDLAPFYTRDERAILHDVNREARRSMDARREVLRLSLDNAILHAAVVAWRDQAYTWDEAMMIAIRGLIESNRAALDMAQRIPGMVAARGDFGT
jgi:hypothetical protein